MADILIRGMEMPKSCGTCKAHFLSGNDYVCCCLTDRTPKSVAKFHNSKIDLDARKKSIETVQRPEWCPLVELPEGHGRLIDADVLYEVAKTRSMGIYGPCDFQCVITGNDILKAHTIVPAEGGNGNG